MSERASSNATPSRPPRGRPDPIDPPDEPPVTVDAPRRWPLLLRFLGMVLAIGIGWFFGYLSVGSFFLTYLLLASIIFLVPIGIGLGITVLFSRFIKRIWTGEWGGDGSANSATRAFSKIKSIIARLLTGAFALSLATVALNAALLPTVLEHRWSIAIAALACALCGRLALVQVVPKAQRSRWTHLAFTLGGLTAGVMMWVQAGGFYDQTLTQSLKPVEESLGGRLIDHGTSGDDGCLGDCKYAYASILIEENVEDPDALMRSALSRPLARTRHSGRVWEVTTYWDRVTIRGTYEQAGSDLCFKFEAFGIDQIPAGHESPRGSTCDPADLLPYQPPNPDHACQFDIATCHVNLKNAFGVDQPLVPASTIGRLKFQYGNFDGFLFSFNFWGREGAASSLSVVAIPRGSRTFEPPTDPSLYKTAPGGRRYIERLTDDGKVSALDFWDGKFHYVINFESAPSGHGKIRYGEGLIALDSLHSL